MTTSGRESILFCHRYPRPEGDVYEHFYPSTIQVNLCSTGREIFQRRVRDVRPGEESPYWAWWENGKQEFRYVYSRRGLVEMCFPDGGEYRTAKGEGQIVNVVVEEVS